MFGQILTSSYGVASRNLSREAAGRPPSTPALAGRSGRVPALPCLPAKHFHSKASPGWVGWKASTLDPKR